MEFHGHRHSGYGYAVTLWATFMELSGRTWDVVGPMAARIRREARELAAQLDERAAPMTIPMTAVWMHLNKDTDRYEGHASPVKPLDEDPLCYVSAEVFRDMGRKRAEDELRHMGFDPQGWYTSG